MRSFVVVIPARYASTRLPGKPLREINGRPMIEHVFNRAVESDAEEVVIATDDERIADAAESFGATVCMTGDQHRSGTERIAEVADLMDYDDETVVVNLQGDEPAMPAALINQCATLLKDSRADLSTLASPIASADDFADPNVVKVVCDAEGFALYFSRMPIPYPRHEEEALVARDTALHHHGIYGYRAGILRSLVVADPAPLEQIEQLEQLRALSMGYRILVAEPTVRPGRGVDTDADLELAAAALRGD